MYKKINVNTRITERFRDAVYSTASDSGLSDPMVAIVSVIVDGNDGGKLVLGCYDRNEPPLPEGDICLLQCGDIDLFVNQADVIELLRDSLLDFNQGNIKVIWH